MAKTDETDAIYIQQPDPNCNDQAVSCGVFMLKVVSSPVTGTTEIILVASTASGTVFNIPVTGIITDQLEKKGLIYWDNNFGGYLIKKLNYLSNDRLGIIKDLIKSIRSMGWYAGNLGMAY